MSVEFVNIYLESFVTLVLSENHTTFLIVNRTAKELPCLSALLNMSGLLQGRFQNHTADALVDEIRSVSRVFLSRLSSINSKATIRVQC